MVRRICRVLLASVLVTGLSLGTADASQGAQTSWFTLDDVEYWNPCSGEDVTMAGSFTLTVQAVEPHDRTVAIYRATLYAEGVGSLGNKYRLTFSDYLRASGDISDGAPSLLRVDERLVLVTNGRAPNVRARYLSGHIVVNANGDLVLNIFNDLQQSCLGSTH